MDKKTRNQTNHIAENNLNHLKFETRKIKFYDDDIKKMKSMTLEQRVEYKAKLKALDHYTYEN